MESYGCEPFLVRDRGKVKTLDFNIANGSRRTQAAAAINQHVALSHSRASRTILWYPKSLIHIEREAKS
jgi:hypothetical protein